jgi:hypothetical protein
LQNPSKTDGDSLNKINCETSRTVRNREREYLKEKKCMSLKRTARSKMSEAYFEISINEFKKGYHPKSNKAKDENGYLLSDSHSILGR